jgi:hypothetical protein
VHLVRARFGGVAKFGDAQRRQARAQPRQSVHGLPAQLLRVSGGQHAASHLHVGKGLGFRIQNDVEGGIGAGRLAQEFKIGK